MPYSGFSKKISDKFESFFSEISAEYNFDLGPEFEIALCKALRIFLPEKYGVCRGFIVTRHGEKVGDDIIIYDQERMPTLRLLENDQYQQKQEIPLEAVYAYFEAKYTLYLDNKGGQTLTKAFSQIEKIKQLSRKPTASTQIDPYTNIQLIQNNQEYWPKFRNPIYTGIFARNIRINNKSTDEVGSFEVLSLLMQVYNHNAINLPDLIIAGRNIVCLPEVEGQMESPFHIKDSSRLTPIKSDCNAVGVGLSALSWAIDWIKLGIIYWPSIIASGLNLQLTNDQDNT